MLDYSFTKSPEWREKRLIDWEVLRGQLAEEFSRKQIEVEEKYFLDGEETEYKGFKIWAGALIYRCPKIDREAWSYFLKERFPPTYNEPANFAQLNHWQGFVDSILDFGLPVGWSRNQFLDLFDFVFGKEFCPVVESEFPIGQNNVIGRALLDKEKIFAKIMRSYSPWVRLGGAEPFLWIYNQVYVKSLIVQLDVNPINNAIAEMNRGVELDGSGLKEGVKLLKKLIGFHKGARPINGTEHEVQRKTLALTALFEVFRETEPYRGAFDELYALVE